jgi:hypothetical protein
MNEANAINKQILANQLKVEEHKEAQKYYKALSYNLFEIVDLISKIDDLMVLNYTLTNYYGKIKSNIIEANDRLDEIGDKAFNKQTLDKLNSIKVLAETKQSDYSTDILNKIDEYLSDFKKEEERINAFTKPNFKPEIIKRNRIGIRRTFSIAILGFLMFTLFFDNINKLAEKWDTSLFIVNLLITTFLVLLLVKRLRKELKWRKEYDDFIKNEQQRQKEFERTKIEMEQKYESNLNKAQEALLNHPFYTAMKEVNKIHPTFDKSLSVIIENETAFEKKWGL